MKNLRKIKLSVLILCVLAVVFIIFSAAITITGKFAIKKDALLIPGFLGVIAMLISIATIVLSAILINKTKDKERKLWIIALVINVLTLFFATVISARFLSSLFNVLIDFAPGFSNLLYVTCYGLGEAVAAVGIVIPAICFAKYKKD